MVEKRFYKYSGIDLLFAPIAKKLTPFFVYFNFSANTITLLSGLVGILGAIFFSTNNKYAILISSLGYITYYFLDYIDGNIARLQNKSSIYGKFLDTYMGPIVSISMAMSIYIGARDTLSKFGINQLLIDTVGIIYVTSIFISNTRYAFVWLTVCTQIVEDKNNKKIKNVNSKFLKTRDRKQNIFIKLVFYFFHENFMIFCLPIIGALNFFIDLDIRFIYPLSGVFILFPACIYDIYTFIKYDKINEVYYKVTTNEEILNPIKIIYLK